MLVEVQINLQGWGLLLPSWSCSAASPSTCGVWSEALGCCAVQSWVPNPMEICVVLLRAPLQGLTVLQDCVLREGEGFL